MSNTTINQPVWARWLTTTIALFVGIVETLLFIRLVARLLAARHSHPVIHLLYRITEPLTSVLSILDEGQPHFGAVLELSTLAFLVLIPVAGYVVWNIFLQLSVTVEEEGC